ncbi:kinase-like domain-containing protein [Rhizophagus irregularis DAOM 181602=DAOM 197198]|nr:kinase-like domain-containing protein [Rhizophagus irregularis DAOM 181602=DAOM 197198]
MEEFKLSNDDITSEFLREIESHTTIISNSVTKCFGITKDPESNNFMMVIEYAKEEPKNATDNKDDDNSFGEYSESIEAIDFTKLNLDENN